MAREIDETEVLAEDTTATTDEAAEAQAEESTEQAEEASTEEATTTETSTEDSTSKADEKPAETGPSDKELFEVFTAAAEGALADESRDESTGTLPAATIAPVAQAYTALGTRYKGNAREWLTEKMTEAMTEGKYLDARSYLELLNGLKSTGSRKETAGKPPVDPTEAHVARAAALMLSVNLLEAEEGVAEDWATKAQEKANELSSQVLAYRNWMAENKDKASDEQTEAPTVDPIVLAAAAAAKGRAVTRKAAASPAGAAKPKAAGDPGARHDTSAHIQEAFADKNPGDWMSIGDIVKFKSTEYGDDEPSPGAIAARLFPGNDATKCKVPGIRPEQRDKKGAVKL
jgi:hypothetical protein